MKHKFQKRIRLKDFSYKGFWRYFVTISTNFGKRYFENKECVQYCTDILRSISEIHKFSVLAYCFMPDHLHLLIEGKEEDSDFKKFISLFKQKTNFHFKKVKGDLLWQENYYEHVLRKEEDTLEIVKYILNNSVRKGLVTDFKNYPSISSFVYDLREMFS
jgi:putative transposase